MPMYTIDINLKKTQWNPKHIEQIADVVSHAWERKVTLAEIQPIVGTDHVKEFEIEHDEDVSEFLKAPSIMQEAFAEKLFRVREPRPRLMPRKWQPKKVKLLATGELLAKFFGEDTMGTREVCTSLKLYECGHFYLKQTLPGQGPTPFWMVYEGSWEQTANGMKLVYRLQYSWQASIKSEPSTSIECQPPGLESTLAWVGESESQLNGLVPAVVGEDKFARVEIVREPDKVEKATSRFNEDVLQANIAKRELPAEASPAVPSGSFKPRDSWLQDGDDSAAGAAKSSSSSPPVGGNAKQQSPAKAPAKADTKGADSEPLWPMIVGIAIFVLAVAFTLNSSSE